MDNRQRTTITLIVNNEERLYAPLSPEPEFDYKTQMYIKTKAAEEDMKSTIDMHVVSREPLNEDRFRTAVSNFVKQERALLRRTEKETLRTFIGLLAFASIFIMLSVALQQRFEVLKYSLLPFMGTLSLSRAARILLLEMPTMNAKEWMLNELEKNSKITFEYESDKELV